jgi:hypothetical protein
MNNKLMETKTFKKSYRHIRAYDKYGRFYIFWSSLIEPHLNAIESSVDEALAKIIVFPVTTIAYIIQTAVFYLFRFTRLIIQILLLNKGKHISIIQDWKSKLNDEYEFLLNEEHNQKILKLLHKDAKKIQRMIKQDYIIELMFNEYVISFPTWEYLESDKVLDMVTNLYDKYNRLGIKVAFSVGLNKMETIK